MKTASTKLAHSTSSGMVESASNKPYLLLEAFFTFINFGEETILDSKDAWVLGFLWGKRPLFILEQVPAPWGTSASSFVKCWDTCGWYRLGQTIAGFFQPWGFVLFMPANLCPFNDLLLSHHYGQALWGHGQEQGGYGLYPQGPAQAPSKVLPCSPFHSHWAAWLWAANARSQEIGIQLCARPSTRC